MVYQLMYYSTARREQTDADLVEILDVSRRNNTAAGITGILLYGEGVFFQVLEGDEEKVKACFERIKADERHLSMLVASERTLPLRSFEAWAMGYMPMDRELHDGVEALVQLKEVGNESGYPDCDPLVRLLIDSFLVNQRLA